MYVQNNILFFEISSFDWDEANQSKIEGKHGIKRDSVEKFFESRPWIAVDNKHSQTEERFLAVGRDPENRPMVVVFTIRKHGDLNSIRPISARYMHAKEAQRYEEAYSKT